MASKNAIVFSTSDLKGTTIRLLNAQNNAVIKEQTLTINRGTWGTFNFHYSFDFSEVQKTGNYYLQIDKKRSEIIQIGSQNYIDLVPQILTFFKVQRCGVTNPLLHENCHIYDSHKIIGDESFGKVDVTGGWHDAGDFIKFTNTTAVTTYLLALSYILNPELHEVDVNKNNAPDILEEVKVGLDWLLRCNYSGTKLITQVQDMRDHEVGWRLPENDSLKFDRPAFKGEGKNISGIYSAALALGAAIWKTRFNETQFSKQCQEAAERIYSASKDIPDIDESYTGMYQDKNYQAKLILAGVELYNLTQKEKYLSEVKALAKGLQPDFWWSWGDLNSLASFRMAQIEKNSGLTLESNVVEFNERKNATIYEDVGIYTWGTTTTLFGIAAQTMLYRKISGSSSKDTLAIKQLDYIFGKNPWGISFVTGAGYSSVKNLHSQVGYFNKGKLPGGIAAGPATNEILKNYSINRKNRSGKEFNTDIVSYFDDREDYITNEPAIVTNASAVLAISLLLLYYK